MKQSLTNKLIRIVMGNSDSEEETLLLLVALRRPQRKRKRWIHPILHNLVNELHLDDEWFFFTCFRMNQEQFQQLPSVHIIGMSFVKQRFPLPYLLQ